MNQENRFQPPKAEVADVRADDETELATRGARFGGAMIDGLLILLVLFPTMMMTGYWQDAMSGKQPSMATQIAYALLGYAAYLVFNGYLLHKSGQTIGKRLVGTRIVSVDENRIIPVWKVLALRQLPFSVVAQIPIVGPLLSLADSLFVFRSDKRCLHDLIAGTKVVQASVTWKAQSE
jgi:uncharacterized RDD family membrane protein YckC